jgi:hypothetical protein
MTSEERREARYQRRKAKRDEARLRRSKECGDFDEVFSFRHLYLSGKKCCKGVYWKNSTQRYIGNIIPIIAKTHRELQNGTFKHRGFHAFTIMERGKKRYIRSVHITERAVQKCLCDYCLVPIYSACFIYDNSASLKHRGMDFALRRMTCYLQRHYRKYGLEGGVLLYDFHSFFDSAPHEPLFREADRRLHDPKIRTLANSFITDFGSVGLGLGSQVSQTNALMLPNMIDHYFKEVCRIKAYERYMDDGVAISPDIDDLYLCMDGLKDHLREVRSGIELEEDEGHSSQRLLPLVENEVHHYTDRQGCSEDEQRLNKNRSTQAQGFPRKARSERNDLG